MQSPIIFCHYGNSKYLPFVFECVKISNPNKDIILLGDDSNKALAKKFGLIHYQFDDFSFGSDIKIFESVYQLICSDGFDSYKHGEDWNKFVFKKWFVLANFLEEKKIEKFWHFDSDVMILDDLSIYEEIYKDFAVTEQCHAHCMKGIFYSNNIIRRYVQKINEMFQRQEFLDENKKIFEKNQVRGCINEMSVYDVFKEENPFLAKHIGVPHDGRCFDDLICTDDGMLMDKLPFGEDVKKVYCNPDGRFFAIDKENSQPIEMIVLNYSWMPIYLFKQTLEHYKKNHNKAKIDFDKNSRLISSLPVPLKQRFKKYKKNIKKLFNKK